MTNTKFRKRALLTSVAMMLVALVALGSATFAWFTANDSVTATGLSVTASTADGLKIAKTAINTAPASAPADNAYAQTVSIAVAENTVWAPVSPIVASAASVTFYSASAESFDSYLMNDTAASSTETGFYATDLWLKATTATSLTVQATIGGTAANYGRVLLVDTNGNSYYLSNDAESTNTIKLDGTTLKPATGEGNTYSSSASNNTLPVSAISTGQQFHVYVYLEGQDPQCIDANAGKTLTVSLTFTKA